MVGWAASPDHVATILIDRTAPSGGVFTDDSYPTVNQVQALLDLYAPQLLADVWDYNFEIPERLFPLARLCHAFKVAAAVENGFSEQVELTQKAEWLDRRAQEYVFKLLREVKAVGDVREAEHGCR